MLVSTFTRMVEKRGMHWERADTSVCRYISVLGKYRCESKMVKLSDIHYMGRIEAWFLLRGIQKRDTFEADAGTLEAVELAWEEYRAAGMPCGDSQEGMLQWINEQTRNAQEEKREEDAK